MTASEIGTHRKPFESRKVFMNMDHPCDLCGGACHVKATHYHTGTIWLCPECRNHIDRQPETIRETVKVFLIGNVL
jgi:ribosomal protein L37AE/L43A